MDAVSKAARAIIPQAVKRASRKAKRSQGVIKPKKILGETITLVRPNMHVRSPPLTPGVKSLLEKELFKAEIKATEPMTSLQPQEITEHLKPSLESFFNKRPYTLKNFNEFLMVLSHQGKVDEAFSVVEKMKVTSKTVDESAAEHCVLYISHPRLRQVQGCGNSREVVRHRSSDLWREPIRQSVLHPDIRARGNRQCGLHRRTDAGEATEGIHTYGH